MNPVELRGNHGVSTESVTLDAQYQEPARALPDSMITGGIGGGESHAPLMADALDSLARLGTELERLSRSVVQRERELRMLIHLMQSVEREVFLEDVLGKIFDSFTDVIPFDRIGCAFLSEDSTRLVAYWAKSQLGAMQIQSGYTQPLAGSSLELIIKTEQPRIINDLETYLSAKPSSDATRRIVAEGGRSSLTCPLVVDGRPIGFLFFTSRYPNTYREAHQYVFRQIASQVATVIERSRGYQQLIDSNRTLLDQSHTLEVMATRDLLAGALNRGAIDGILARHLREHQGSTSTDGVIMVDVDYFKNINDAFGHPSGDLVLKEFVIRLNGVIRRSDALGRYGGEEFLIIVNDSTAEHLLDTMERLRRAICDEPFDVGGRRYAVTASFGGALVTPGTSLVEDLIRRADKALYEAKGCGRNCCVLAAE
jgi:diguanylate cyclase (GGDEF)-like protein